MCGCDKNYLISSCSLDNQTDHVCVCLVTQLHLTLVTLWTVACQAPLSTGSSRQEYHSDLRQKLQS